MNEQLKQKAGLIYNVIEAVILGMAVLLNVWNSKMVIDHETQIAKEETKTGALDVRLTRVELTGSSSLVSHEKEDDQRVGDLKIRVEKLESAVLALQSTPGELKAIGVSLQSLHEGQKRIEERMEKANK